MKVKTIAFILLAVILTLFTTPVYAQGDIPPLPHAFYGEVKINGSTAPVGTEVEVRGEGVVTGVDGNPIVTIADGKYGSSDPLEPKLIVQGNIAEGATLTFYANGVATGQTAEWHSGEVTKLNLTATIEGPPPGTTEPPAPKPAAFSLSSFIISPNEVAPGESVTLSVQVANTGEVAGNYELALKIDGVVEASKQITVNAGASQKVTFNVSKDVAKTYSLDINGLSGTFVVIEGAPPAPPAPPPAPPAPPPAPTAPAEPVNWPVLWGVTGGVIVVGVIIFLVARRKKAY